ncbi:STAS domain-containing protein [bacterium]|nr:STAS domain-containing protein [bacterium]
MDQPVFACHSEVREKTLIIVLEGDITDACEESVFHAYRQMEQHDLDSIILDFGKVLYINSAGIAVCINLLTRMRQKQQQLNIVNLSEYFQKIFAMIGLTRYSRYYPTVDDALADMKRERSREK